MSKIFECFLDKAKTITGYPKTLTKAVYDDNGNRLDNTLTALNENLSKNLPFITIHPTYGNGTFQDIVDTVINTLRPVVWSNWGDSTNFPAIYMSGMAYPSVDSSNIMFLGRCSMAAGGGTYSGVYSATNRTISWQKLVTESDLNNLTANRLDTLPQTHVASTTYTEFIAPNDGYLGITTTATDGDVHVSINTQGTHILNTVPNTLYHFLSIYLRKGTKVYIKGDGTNGIYYFSSLT